MDTAETVGADEVPQVLSVQQGLEKQLRFCGNAVDTEDVAEVSLIWSAAEMQQ